MNTDKKITAVHRSGNSNAPMRVSLAPTQRNNPHRYNHYMFILIVLQYTATCIFHEQSSIPCRPIALYGIFYLRISEKRRRKLWKERIF